MKQENLGLLTKLHPSQILTANECKLFAFGAYSHIDILVGQYKEAIESNKESRSGR